ncbi:GIY-YIG nuclease family protein [Rosistilla ulvae]|uniref:GIY-YIG nuclease family protein n=1 Tax=Rosistilla ulvae TaxID=1930277 RepID=UPI001FE60630|nr:GIY-YIG nuclease family protein [Rosistilla ulvae]
MSTSSSPQTPSESSQPSSSPSGWFVYIVRCGDGSLYTGITKDLRRRLKQHNAGTASRYTRVRLPVAFVYQETQPDQSSALKRELAIKALTRPAKDRLIGSETNRLGELDCSP